MAIFGLQAPSNTNTRFFSSFDPAVSAGYMSQSRTYIFIYFTSLLKKMFIDQYIAMNCERDYTQEGRQRGGHHGTGNKEGVWLVRLSGGIGLERLN